MPKHVPREGSSHGQTGSKFASDPVMSNAKLKSNPALADLIRDLALAQEAREKWFADIVRLVRRREASGPAKDMMAQIRRDHQLCKLLVDYEKESEIIGMMELVLDLKMKSSRRGVRNW
jgi:hypothetical protein